MDGNPLLGAFIFALGGFAGAVFSVPFRRVRGWSYESYWFLNSVAGLILFPLLLALCTVPDLFGLFARVPGGVLAKCAAFGALWGLGGLTWGLMLRYLGIGLGYAIGCGLCSATGTLLPPIVAGEGAKLIDGAGALVTLAGVLVSLVGIVCVGAAGFLKERELPPEAKKASVAEFDFRKGLWVALFAGTASAGMNFGLQGAVWSEGAARVSLDGLAKAAGAADCWTGLPVLVIVLAGGFVVNGGWCIWANCRNRTLGDYVGRAGAKGPMGPLAANYLFASLAGVIWACQFACQKIGEPVAGKDVAYVGYALVLGSSVLFSSLLGVVFGEWRGTGRRTRMALTCGLFLLAVSIVLSVLGRRF